MNAAYHKNDQHTTFDGLVKIIKHRRKELAPPMNTKSFPRIHGVIQFPVLVLDGEMYEASGNTEATLTLKEVDYIKYRISDFDLSSNKPDDYYIHVVKESFFETFLEQVELEGQYVLSQIVEKGDMVREMFNDKIGRIPRMF